MTAHDGETGVQPTSIDRSSFDYCGFTVPESGTNGLLEAQSKYLGQLEAFGRDTTWRPETTNDIVYSDPYNSLVKYHLAKHAADEHANNGNPMTRRCAALYLGALLGNELTFLRFADMQPRFDTESQMYKIDRKDLRALEPVSDITMKGQVLVLRNAFFHIRDIALGKKRTYPTGLLIQ